MASLSITLRNTILSAVAAACPDGDIQVRTGNRPLAGAQATATGTLMATIDLDSTPFAAPSNGSMSLADLELEVPCNVSGTVGYLRFRDASGNGHVDIRVTEIGGGGEATMVDTTVEAGEPIRITVGTISMPIGTEGD